jgi:signal transduction protein with GAF and PtsI domain
MYDRGLSPQSAPIEARVEKLEADVERLRREFTDSIDRLSDTVQDQANKAFFDAYEHVLQADDQLRRFIAQQLSGGLGTRTWGVVALTVGIVLGVAGNVISSYCVG